MTLPLLHWIQRIQAIAQSGLAFSPNEYDRMRFEALRTLAAEMASYPDGEPESVSMVFAGEKGYATPKLISRAAVIDAGKILMVREVMDGKWSLPGGWVDIGDSPAESVRREVLEETGLTVEVIKLAAVYDKLKHDHPPAPNHSYLVYFLCDLVGGEPSTSVETEEVGWFGENEIPEVSKGRVTTGQIARMFEHWRNPGLPTDFD
jgi:ADP-ribose pyrophosphatase YjhB (NUDIX family)